MTWDEGKHPRQPQGAPGGTGGEFAPGNYSVMNDVRDAYRGDVYGAVMVIDDKAKTYVAKLPYAAGRQVVNIHHIETDPAHRGRGLASAMVDKLKEEFPHHKVHWGMTTPDGEAFKRAYYAKPHKVALKGS